jgi:hypothetical protein
MSIQDKSEFGQKGRGSNEEKNFESAPVQREGTFKGKNRNKNRKESNGLQI